MKIAILLPDVKLTGVNYYSIQLFHRVTLPKEFISFQERKHGPSLSFLYYLTRVLKSNASIYHIQLEPRFFKNFVCQMFLPVLALLCKLKGKLIVTFHAIIDPNDVPLLLQDSNYRWLKLLSHTVWNIYIMVNKFILALADRVIVHNSLIQTYLSELFKVKSKKVIVIPHGTILVKKGEQKQQPLILYLGSLRACRSIISIIHAFKILQKDIPLAQLSMLLFISEERYNMTSIFRKLTDIMKMSKDDPNIRILVNPSETEIENILRKTSIGVLPYRENTLESSGVAWRYAGLGIPFIGTRVPKLLYEFSFLNHFNDTLFLKDFTPIDLARSIKVLLLDNEVYKKISKLLLGVSRSRSWSRVAKMHMRVYREVLLK